MLSKKGARIEWMKLTALLMMCHVFGSFSLYNLANAWLPVRGACRER